jgi:hypothetical protein
MLLDENSFTCELRGRFSITATFRFFEPCGLKRNDDIIDILTHVIGFADFMKSSLLRTASDSPCN